MRKTLKLVVCFLSISCQPVFAEAGNAELLNEIRALRKQIQKQEERINDLEARLAKEQEKPTIQLADGSVERINDYMLGGIDISAGITSVVQGTHNANGDSLSGKGEDVTDGSYSLNLVFEKNFEDYGKAFIGVETGDGAGVEDELQVFSNVNRDADDSDSALAVTEVWYEHYFKSIPVSIMAGKIDATVLIDDNAYANDECTQFLGRIFRNSPTIELPDNAGGLKLDISPCETFEIRFVGMDGDGDWEDIGSNIFGGAQVTVMPDLFDREGNYRFFGWINDREHIKWTDSSKTKEESYGFGISFDQELTDSLGAFLRYAWQDPDVYLMGESFSLEHSWSSGLQVTGSAWGREEDVFAIAVGQIMPSDEYKKAGSNLNAENEGHIEAYYNYKVNEHLVLTPDIQIIWNPYGDDASNGNDTIAVVGMRGQMDF